MRVSLRTVLFISRRQRTAGGAQCGRLSDSSNRRIRSRSRPGTRVRSISTSRQRSTGPGHLNGAMRLQRGYRITIGMIADNSGGPVPVVASYVPHSDEEQPRLRCSQAGSDSAKHYRFVSCATSRLTTTDRPRPKRGICCSGA
jgi:hypothetical protein